MTIIKNVRKSDDYAIVYADGIITEVGSDVTKLIFYQNVNLPNSEDIIDQQDVTRILQFEVRIPRIIMKKIAHVISSSEDSIDSSREVLGYTTDERTRTLVQDLAIKLQHLLFDSNENLDKNSEMQLILDQIDEANARLQEERGEASQ